MKKIKMALYKATATPIHQSVHKKIGYFPWVIKCIPFMIVLYPIEYTAKYIDSVGSM